MVHLRPPLAQADGRPIATLAQDRSCGGDSPESLTHVPRGTSGQDSSSADAPADARAQEAVAAHQREDAQVFLSHVPRGTFVRGPSRTVRRADALAWMAERMFEPADAPVLASDYQPARVGHQTTEATSDIITRDHRHPERIPRDRHRLRDRDRALARGAHRLRPCADGDDGVMGFRRHRSGGGTGGRRLEPIVGADRRQHFDPSQVSLRVRALGCSKTSFVAEGTSLKPSRMRG